MNFKGRKVLIRVKCMWQWVGYLNWKTCTSARLSSECLLSPLSFPKASNDTLTTALLIRRSLRRHSEDILSDADLMQNDILCLTETQLYLNEDTSDITTKFQNNFSMYYNSSTDKHRGIAFGYLSNIFLCECWNFL